MPLLEAKSTYKPFEYPWAYDAWKLQQQIHWMADEISMADDVQDWKYKLTTAEKNLCTQIFRFFTQADIEVNNCYMEKYAKVFKPNEIKMMLCAFSNMETIHADAYSHLIDTLGMPDTIYEEFLNYKAMRDKYEYMHTFDMDSIEHMALTMAAFGAFTEGLQLFASFAILVNFQRFGKMKGMGQIIAYSARDETVHTKSIIKLFHTLVSEHPEVWTEDLRAQIYTTCSTVVYFEDSFIDLAFEIDGAIQGLTAQEVKKYIRYIADRRLVELNLKPIYLVEDNPLPWMDFILNGLEHTNFFENKATEYTKAATTGSWDDAFNALHDKKNGVLFEANPLQQY